MAVFCPKCGAQVPDDANFCPKCGAQVRAPAGVGVGQGQPGGDQGQGQAARPGPSSAGPGPGPGSGEVLAPAGVTALKCPSCGAPLTPKFGEMIITCEYCGTSVALASDGWRSVQRHTMLPLKFSEEEKVEERVRELMDRGLLHRHLAESSVKEEFALRYVPYWVVTASARTKVTSQNVAAQVGQTATEMAVLGVLLGGMGGGFGGGRGRMAYGMGGAGLGVAMGAPFLFMGAGGNVTVNTIEASYNFPVIAVKSLMQYQPKDYEFALDERVFFDASKVKSAQVLSGDLGEEAARSQAKAIIEQLQSERAHREYHMVQRLETEVELSEVELLHAPVWFARYDHKGRKIVLLIDGNSGNTISSIGL